MGLGESFRMTVHTFRSRKEMELDSEQIEALREMHGLLKETVDELWDELTEAISDLAEFEEDWEI